jgi:hypothetical protein
MNPEKYRLVEQRAYALWLAEGQPHGKHEEHWRQAIHEIETEESASPRQKRSRKRGASRVAARPRTPAPHRQEGAQA